MYTYIFLKIHILGGRERKQLIGATKVIIDNHIVLAN
jgi:hypothetical protein